MNQQTVSSMKDVQDLIAQVRKDPRTDNRPVLGVNVIRMQQAKNNGFPLHMYHQTLDAVIALTDAEKEALERVGYTEHYIARAYPKFKFRRNMDPKLKAAGFIEERTVRDEVAETALGKRQEPGCGPWVDRVGDIEPLPEASTEDPKITQARLEGQLAELREIKAKKG